MSGVENDQASSAVEQCARRFAEVGGRDALASLARAALDTYGLTKESAERTRVTIPDYLNQRDGLGTAIRKLLVDEAHAEILQKYGDEARSLREGAGRARVSASQGDPTDSQARAILTEAYQVWTGIDRGTHTASDLDEVLDPSRWSVERQPSDAEVLAALNRYYVPDGLNVPQTLSDWSEGSVRAMRAVLRGDYEVDE